MKGVRQLDTGVFLLLALITPLVFYFFLNHLDWSRATNTPRAKPVPAHMPQAADTPVSPQMLQRMQGGGGGPPGPQAGGRGGPPAGGQRGGGGRGNNAGGPPGGMQPQPAGPPGARGGAMMAGAPPAPGAGGEGAEADSSPPPKVLPRLNGTIEQTIVAEVPDFSGFTRPVAVQMQDCYEVIQQSEKTYRLSLYISLGFLALALISAYMNRTTRTQLRTQLSDAAG
jgi:hypothetical protein